MGNIYSFSGYFNEDHLSNPDTPFHWHCDKDVAGYGTLNDLGYHIIGKLVYLFGIPNRVAAYRQTKVTERRDEKEKTHSVTSDDMASALIQYEDF